MTTVSAAVSQQHTVFMTATVYFLYCNQIIQNATAPFLYCTRLYTEGGPHQTKKSIYPTNHHCVSDRCCWALSEKSHQRLLVK